MAWKESDPGPMPDLPKFFNLRVVGDKFQGAFVGYRQRNYTQAGKPPELKHDYTFLAESGAGTITGKDAAPGELVQKGKLYTISANWDLNRRLQKAIKDGLKPGHAVAMVIDGINPKANGMKTHKVMTDSDNPVRVPSIEELFGAAPGAAPGAGRQPEPPPHTDEDVPF